MEAATAQGAAWQEQGSRARHARFSCAKTGHCGGGGSALLLARWGRGAFAACLQHAMKKASSC